MKAKILPVVVGKETVSDDYYTVIDICFSNGERVNIGDVLFSFETSKSIVDFESEAEGYIYFKIEEGQRITVGEVCAAICSSTDIPEGYFSNFSQKDIPEDADQDAATIRISKAARKLLDENSLDISIFKGKTIVRTDDIRQYLSTKSTRSNISATQEIDSERDLIILGGGGHAKMCIDIVRLGSAFNIVGILDPGLEIGTNTLGIPVLGSDCELESLFEAGIKNVVIGIGALQNPTFRQNTYVKLKKIGFKIPNIIHPGAIIESSAKLGDGNQIMAGAIIGSNVRIGNNCIVNSGSIISHDSQIWDNVHITPGAILAGSVEVQNDTIIGMGATVFLNTRIGKNVVISNGKHIFKDVPDGTFVKND